MKTKIGGTIGFKVMPNAYEPITIESTYEIEVENKTEEEIEALNEKINKRLKEDLRKRAEIALQEYDKFKTNLKNVF